MTDTGLADATAYHYQVVALDGDGNASGTSNTVTATTADITAPNGADRAHRRHGHVEQRRARAGAPPPTTSACSATASCATVSPSRTASSTTTSFTDTDTDLQGGVTYTYTVVAFDAAANTSPPSTSVQATTLANVIVPVTLVAPGSSWRYLDNGVDLGTGWRSPTYNDASWAVGNAQFGYGEGDEATVVSYGPDPDKRYVTTYFRKTINVTNPANAQRRRPRDPPRRRRGRVPQRRRGRPLQHARPAPSSSRPSPTSTSPSPTRTPTSRTSIPATLFSTGTNTLAVELHQKGWTNQDLSFDLRLTANQSRRTRCHRRSRRA